VGRIGVQEHFLLLRLLFRSGKDWRTRTPFVVKAIPEEWEGLAYKDTFCY
jgi:hypothetical protein